MRQIDADALVDAFAEQAKNMEEVAANAAWMQAVDDLPNCYNGYSDTYDKAYIIGVLEEQPSVDVPDRKVGKWVERGENDDGTHNIQCSACEAGYKSKGHANSIYTKQRFRFCPNCGAKMESE